MPRPQIEPQSVHSSTEQFDVEVRADDRGRQLVVDLDIDAPPADVFEAISDAKQIVNWFAFEARSTPGVGGEIVLIWPGHHEGTCKITEWVENERLATTWQVEDPDTGKTVDLVVSYQLEGKGGKTTLRLVHAGFGRASSWDEIVSDHKSGWSFELRSLRHYLENHRGKKRGMVKLEQEITVSAEVAWNRLFEDGGFMARAVGSGVAGEPYAGEAPTGDAMTGKLMIKQPPTDLAITIDSLDRALLRLSIARWGTDPATKVRLWLFSWQLSKEACQRLEADWGRQLTAALA